MPRVVKPRWPLLVATTPPAPVVARLCWKLDIRLYSFEVRFSGCEPSIDLARQHVPLERNVFLRVPVGLGLALEPLSSRVRREPVGGRSQSCAVCADSVHASPCEALIRSTRAVPLVRSGYSDVLRLLGERILSRHSLFLFLDQDGRCARPTRAFYPLSLSSASSGFPCDLYSGGKRRRYHADLLGSQANCGKEPFRVLYRYRDTSTFKGPKGAGRWLRRGRFHGATRGR